MLRFSSIFMLAGVISIALSQVADYCGRDDLCKSKPHVTCGATGTTGPKCPPGAYLVGMEDKDKQQIVDMHNKFRNSLAGGKMSGFKPAARMASVKWNEELAQYAALNVLTCDYGHDCHNTPEFPSSGQNIFSQSVIGNNVDYEEVTAFIKQSLSGWWDEYKMSSQTYIDNCCGPKSTWHFLAMSQEKQTEIGCAISRYPESATTKTSYIVCNYRTTNLSNAPVYKTGSPASKCQSGTNSQYPNLCSTSESY